MGLLRSLQWNLRTAEPKQHIFLYSIFWGPTCGAEPPDSSIGYVGQRRLWDRYAQIFILFLGQLRASLGMGRGSAAAAAADAAPPGQAPTRMHPVSAVQVAGSLGV